MSIQIEKPGAVTPSLPETLPALPGLPSRKCQQQFDTALGHSSTTHAILRQIGTSKTFEAIPATGGESGSRFVAVPENVSALFRAKGYEKAMSLWVFLQETGRLSFSSSKASISYVAATRGWTMPELAAEYSIGRAKPVNRDWISDRLKEIEETTGLTTEKAYDPLTGRDSGSAYYPHLIRRSEKMTLPGSTIGQVIDTKPTSKALATITASITPPSPTINPSPVAVTYPSSVTAGERATKATGGGDYSPGLMRPFSGVDAPNLRTELAKIVDNSNNSLSPEYLQSINRVIQRNQHAITQLSESQSANIIKRLGDESEANLTRTLYLQAVGATTYKDLTPGHSGTGALLLSALFGKPEGQAVIDHVNQAKEQESRARVRQEALNRELQLQAQQAEAVPVEAVHSLAEQARNILTKKRNA